MKYLVCSDIHSNLEALHAVFAGLAADEALLCLGDIVGYGPNPNECVAAVRARARTAVLGNHDLAAIENYGLQYFNENARTAIEWTQGVLTPEHVAWLGELQYEHRTAEYLLVHGAPVRYFSYILNAGDARRAFSACDDTLIFVGHSHIAEYYALKDSRIEHRHMQHSGCLRLEAGTRYIINVGSVGQPRDLNPEASFATFDSEERRVSWTRVPYDIAVVRDKIAVAELPPYLGERLSAGR